MLQWYMYHSIVAQYYVYTNTKFWLCNLGPYLENQAIKYRNFITDFTSIHILITIFLPKRSGTEYNILHKQLFRLLGASTCQQCYFFGNDRSKRWKTFNSTMFVCCKINKKAGIYFDSFFSVYFSTFSADLDTFALKYNWANRLVYLLCIWYCSRQ